MDSFSATLAAVESLKKDGIVSDYAVGGAMALTFWSEPTATFDLDVFVLLRQDGTLLSLDSIYSWARANGYKEKAEHIWIAGVPVQFIPAHNALAEEAVATAANLDYDGQPVRVIRPEYLIGMYLEPTARTKKRMERVASLLDEHDLLDRKLLDDLVKRYKLDLNIP